MKKENINVKKRLMFNKEDDHYFITYNVIVFLNALDCTSEQNKFVDYTKLTYIVPFISDLKLMDLFLLYNNLKRQPSKNEIDVLQDVYIKSRLHLKLLTTILFSLENQNIIGLSKNSTRNCLDVWINKDNIPSNFLNSELFNVEVFNSIKLKKVMPKIKTITNQTLLKNLFKNNGVRVWEI